MMRMMMMIKLGWFLAVMKHICHAKKHPLWTHVSERKCGCHEGIIAANQL